MVEPLEDSYFRWLCAKVISPHNRNYQDLLRILYSTEFIWLIAGDRNREEDGLELRDYFISETYLENEPDWFTQPCSVLEVLISFAQRASFQTDEPVRDWFMEFLTNLGLNEFRRVSRSDILIIEGILNTFIWRTYEPSGRGGLFPLREPKNDQRKIEIWYQFCEYLEDQGRF